MRVAVDQTGQDTLASGVDHLGVGRQRRQLGCRAHPVDDARAGNEGPVFQDVQLLHPTPAQGGLTATRHANELSGITDDEDHAIISTAWPVLRRISRSTQAQASCAPAWDVGSVPGSSSPAKTNAAESGGWEPLLDTRAGGVNHVKALHEGSSSPDRNALPR